MVYKKAKAKAKAKVRIRLGKGVVERTVTELSHMAAREQVEVVETNGKGHVETNVLFGVETAGAGGIETTTPITQTRLTDQQKQ